MRRESIKIYLGEDVDPADVEDVLERGVLVGEIRDGGIAQAIEEASSWKVLPTFLVLDIGDEEDIGTSLERLGKLAPDGETNLILLGLADNVKIYRELKQLGVAEYIPYPVTADDIYDAVLRLANERATSTVDPSRCIAFVSARGGVGGSTLAAAACKVMTSLHERRVLLLDLDVSSGVQHVLFDKEQTVGLDQMLDSPDRVDALFLERTMIEGSNNLFILSMADLTRQGLVSAESVMAIVRQAQQGIDMVVMDIPSRSSMELEGMFLAGTIYICTTPTILGLRDAAELYQYLDSKSYPGKIVVILNKTNEVRGISVKKEEFERRLRSKVIELPFDPKTPAQAIMETKTIFDVKGPLSAAFRKLIEELPTYTAVQESFFQKLFKK